ncbi:tRNA (adenosine(37)-N6)-threonylcarbamoyltransferase complex dimerization subunit type 1 TsaB [Lachnospira multipara]|uniref:tRNA (adenosine(37)-N6)-threonylcarbamoyltransferase complex dimerization subunit type 1 TsaB n=1 Tax=Lachnospira multipara TaxID=28051 RepID=UPI0004886B3E|nr:tRNA (adenosine(37)-N6)-threonylcarbamoyltransferase complex dimerization subunit type 1 TsaB [Lachnospira multipara]
MKILAIESSAITASTAIVDEENVIAEYTINHKKTHSQTLLPMIDEICAMTETEVDDIDAIAVSVGPGSFTGLRIGVATAKGIALSKDKPMIAVSTLEGLAYNLVGTSKVIVPIMDAKRKHVYSGIYTFENGQFKELRKTNLIAIEDLAKELNDNYEDVVFLGDGIEVARDYFKENLKINYTEASIVNRKHKASSVALRALDLAKEGKLESGDNISPDYLRPSQAERELEAKKKRS